MKTPWSNEEIKMDKDISAIKELSASRLQAIKDLSNKVNTLNDQLYNMRQTETNLRMMLEEYEKNKRTIEAKLQEPLMKYDPVDGSEKPYPCRPDDYRAYHGTVAWLRNPWTGQVRDPRDIGSDVTGLLMQAPKPQQTLIGSNDLAEEPKPKDNFDKACGELVAGLENMSSKMKFDAHLTAVLKYIADTVYEPDPSVYNHCNQISMLYKEATTDFWSPT